MAGRVALDIYRELKELLGKLLQTRVKRDIYALVVLYTIITGVGEGRSGWPRPIP